MFHNLEKLQISSSLSGKQELRVLRDSTLSTMLNPLLQEKQSAVFSLMQGRSQVSPQLKPTFARSLLSH